MSAAPIDNRLRLFALGLGLLAGAPLAPAHASSVTLEDVLRGTLRPDRLATLMQDENVKTAAGEKEHAPGAIDWSAHTPNRRQRMDTSLAPKRTPAKQTQHKKS